MAEHDQDEKAKDKRVARAPGGPMRTPDVAKVRTIVARVVWAVFVIFALVLASAALLIAVKANENNDLVEFVLDFARSVDFGLFDLENPIKGFDGENGAIKTALFNYGLGAVVYLVVGRVLERIIRP